MESPFHKLYLWTLLSRCIQNLSSSYHQRGYCSGFLSHPLFPCPVCLSTQPVPSFSVDPDSDHVISLLRTLQGLPLPSGGKAKTSEALCGLLMGPSHASPHCLLFCHSPQPPHPYAGLSFPLPLSSVPRTLLPDSSRAHSNLLGLCLPILFPQPRSPS